MGSCTHNFYCRFCWQYRLLRKDVVIPHWLHHHEAALLQWWRFRESWIAWELTEYFKLVASCYAKNTLFQQLLTYPLPGVCTCT